MNQAIPELIAALAAAGVHDIACDTKDGTLFVAVPDVAAAMRRAAALTLALGQRGADITGAARRPGTSRMNPPTGGRKHGLIPAHRRGVAAVPAGMPRPRRHARHSPSSSTGPHTTVGTGS